MGGLHFKLGRKKEEYRRHSGRHFEDSGAMVFPPNAAALACLFLECLLGGSEQLDVSTRSVAHEVSD